MKRLFASAFLLLGSVGVARAQVSAPTLSIDRGNVAQEFSATSAAKATLQSDLAAADAFSGSAAKTASTFAAPVVATALALPLDNAEPASPSPRPRFLYGGRDDYRWQLGIATSLNQFSRAIGGALGVAILGAVLTAGLSSQLVKAATGAGSIISAEQAESLASNPNALIEPSAKASLPPGLLPVLQDAMAAAIKPVFLVVVVMCVLAFLASFVLPREKVTDVASRDRKVGERMLMAEQTTINARNEPVCEPE